MKKKLVYLFISSIFLFIFIVFFLGLNKENLYTPKEVKKSVPKKDAEEAKKKLEAAGAKVELK